MTDNSLEFTRRIIDGEPDNKSRIITVLEARGFLINWGQAGIVLSDNAHKHDESFLHKFFPTESLDEDTCQKAISDFLNSKTLSLLFQTRRGTEAGGIGAGQRYTSRLSYFLRRRHGFKIPVEFLDPFICRLVKAVSAAGVLTYNCCDGHWGQKRNAFITCCGVFSLAWLEFLIEKTALSTGIEFSYKARNTTLSLELCNSSWVNHYITINMLAADIYRNRILYRKQLKDLKDTIREDLKPNMHYAEVCSIFRNSID